MTKFGPDVNDPFIVQTELAKQKEELIKHTPVVIDTHPYRVLFHFYSIDALDKFHDILTKYYDVLDDLYTMMFDEHSVRIDMKMSYSRLGCIIEDLEAHEILYNVHVKIDDSVVTVKLKDLGDHGYGDD